MNRGMQGKVWEYPEGMINQWWMHNLIRGSSFSFFFSFLGDFWLEFHIKNTHFKKI